jgi:hypothetical protein
MTTSDSLQRLRCYDDDMVDPTGSSNATGCVFLSLLFIYVLIFLSVLQSSFLYTWLEYVLFIIINYIYSLRPIKECNFSFLRQITGGMKRL